METIGKLLREARESLGLTLEEVERATRIRAVRLEAMENGEFDSLPSRVQAQGFLHNYAEYLGLDPEPILEQFRQSDQTTVRRKVGQAQPSSSRRRRIRLYGDQIITGAVALAVIALLVWGANRILITLNQPTLEEEAAVTQIEPSPSPLPTNTAQLIGEANPPVEATLEILPTASPTLPLGLVDRIELEILAEQSAFVQVVVDGSEAFQGRLPVGERLSFQGEERVEVVTGNARGLRVFFNGQDQGLMGQVNQVLTRVWTIRGMQTPTPTQTLTPTASPPATTTPSPTITPVATLGG